MKKLIKDRITDFEKKMDINDRRTLDWINQIYRTFCSNESQENRNVIILNRKKRILQSVIFF